MMEEMRTQTTTGLEQLMVSSGPNQDTDILNAHHNSPTSDGSTDPPKSSSLSEASPHGEWTQISPNGDACDTTKVSSAMDTTISLLDLSLRKLPASNDSEPTYDSAITKEDSIRCIPCQLPLHSWSRLQQHNAEVHCHSQLVEIKQEYDSAEMNSLSDGPAMKDETMKCLECKIDFENENQLRSHILVMHYPPIQHCGSAQKDICTLCGERVPGGEEAMRQHDESHAVSGLLRLNNGELLNGVSFGYSTGKKQSGSGGVPSLDTCDNGIDGPPKVFNAEAYCEICNKEFCNKYFLKTHKANKHGIPYISTPSKNITLSSGEPKSGVKKVVSPPKDIVIGPHRISPTELFPKNCAFYEDISPDSKTNAQLMSKDATSTNLSKPNPPAMPKATIPEAFCPLCQQTFPNPFLLQTHFFAAHNPFGSSNIVPVQHMYDFMNPLSGSQQMFGTLPMSMNAISKPDAMNSAQQNPFVSQLAGMLTGNLHPGYTPPSFPGMMPPQSMFCSSPSLVPGSGIGNTPLDFSKTTAYSQSDDQTATVGGLASTPKTSPSGGKEAFCEICQKEFCNKYFLRTHKFNKHGIVVPESPQTIKCPKSTSIFNMNQIGSSPPQEMPLKSTFDSADKVASCTPTRSPDLDPPPPKIKKEADDELPARPDPSDSTHDPPQDHLLLQVCDICAEIFPSSFDLASHRQSKHCSEELSTIPLYIASDQPSTDLTLASAPPGIDPEAYCELCRKEFCSKYFLKTHKLNIHGIAMDLPSQVLNGSVTAAPLALPWKDVTSPPNTRTADVIATPTTAVTTTSTGSGSRSSGTGGKNFCDICNKELCNKYFLRTHMAKMHGLKIDENKIIIGTAEISKGFQCEICGKELSSRHFLKMHRFNSHGIKDELPNTGSGNPSLIDGNATPSEDTNNSDGNQISTSIPTSLPSDIVPSVSHTALDEKFVNGTEIKIENSASGPELLGDSRCSSPQTNRTGSVSSVGSVSQSLKPTDKVTVTPNENRYFSHFREVCRICNRRFKSTKWLRTHMWTEHATVASHLPAIQCTNAIPQPNDHTDSEICEIQQSHHLATTQNSMPVATARVNQLPTDSAQESPQFPFIAKESLGELQAKSSVSDIMSSSDPSFVDIEGFPADLKPPGVNRKLQEVCLPNGDKMYRCTYCPYATRWLSNLCVHEKRHTGDKAKSGPKTYTCNICLRSYRYQHSLQRHMSVHKYASAFQNMQQYQHLRSVSWWGERSGGSSNTTGILPDRLDLLRSPLKRTPPSGSGGSTKFSSPNKSSPDSRRHRCSLCNKIFKTRDMWRIHLYAVHRGTDNLAVLAGLNGFGGGTNVENNGTNSSPRKIYRCKLCRHGTRIYEELRQHLFKEHNKKPRPKSTSTSTPEKDGPSSVDADISIKAANESSPSDPEGASVNQPNKALIPQEASIHQEPLAFGQGTPDVPSLLNMSSASPRPFMMQPFVMRETTSSGFFVSSMVYLPVCREVKAPIEASFTFVPLQPTSGFSSAMVPPPSFQQNLAC